MLLVNGPTLTPVTAQGAAPQTASVRRSDSQGFSSCRRVVVPARSARGHRRQRDSERRPIYSQLFRPRRSRNLSLYFSIDPRLSLPRPASGRYRRHMLTNLSIALRMLAARPWLTAGRLVTVTL